MEMLSSFLYSDHRLRSSFFSLLISLHAIKPHLFITQAVHHLQRLPQNKLLVTFARNNNCGRWPFCK